MKNAGWLDENLLNKKKVKFRQAIDAQAKKLS